MQAMEATQGDSGSTPSQTTTESMDALFETQPKTSEGAGDSALFRTEEAKEQEEGEAPGGGGKASSLDWLGEVSDDARRFVEAKNPKSPGDLVDMYREAERQISRLAAEKGPPGPDASEEERAAYFARVGRPKEPEGYKPPEGAEVDPDFWSVAQKGFFDAGLNPAQADKLVETYNALVESSQERMKAQADAQRAAFIDKVKQERGEDGFRAFASHVKAGASELGFDEATIMSMASSIGEGGWEKVMGGLSRVGALFSGDQGPPINSSGAQFDSRSDVEIWNDQSMPREAKVRLMRLRYDRR